MARAVYTSREDSLNKGLAADPYSAPLPQKTITPVSQPPGPNFYSQPVSAPPPPAWAAPAPAPAPAPGVSWADYSKSLNDATGGGSLENGFGGGRPAKILGDLGNLIGFQGPATFNTTYQAAGMNEGGETSYSMNGVKANPELLAALQNYRFNPTSDLNADLYDASGNRVGSFQNADKTTGFDKLAMTGIPLALGALAGGAAMGAFGGAAPAASTGLNLVDSVYGLGGAMGPGVEAGSLGGLAGSTTGLGGLGSMLPPELGAGAFTSAAPAAGLDMGGSGADALDAGGPGAEPPAEYRRPSVDSQSYNAANNITSPVNTTPPPSVDLGSLGSYSTGSGLTDKLANALQAAQVNPAGAASGALSSVANFAKANPGLAITGASALGTLLGGTPSMPNLTGGTGSTGSGNLSPSAQAVAASQGALDFSQIPGLKTTAGNPNTFNQSAIDAAYQQQTRYLDPQIQQQQQALEARLAEQGFVPGTPAYNQAMRNFMDTNQRAYAQARDSSILQGTQIGQADFRNAISDATLNNSAAAQALSQYITQRNQPINERNALMTGDQILYDRNLDQYNAKVAESNSRNQALSQLALALGMYLG